MTIRDCRAAYSLRHDHLDPHKYSHAQSRGLTTSVKGEAVSAVSNAESTDSYTVLICPLGGSSTCAAFIINYTIPKSILIVLMHQNKFKTEYRFTDSRLSFCRALHQKNIFFPYKVSNFYAKSLKDNTFLLMFKAICTILLLQTQPLNKHMLQGIPIWFPALTFSLKATSAWQ